MEILAKLNDRQREAVTHVDGPLLVIAGAGSGKTRALTHRIAYMIQGCGVSPWNILAVTFTNKAANEMKERVAKLLGKKIPQRHGWSDIDLSVDFPTMGTFHSVCVRILRKYAHLLDYENSFVIYDEADQLLLMKQVMEALRIDAKQMNPRSILAHISGAKNQLLSPSGYRQFSHGSHFTERVAELYEPYQQALKKNNAMDFDDLLMKTVELFQKFPDVLDECQEKFRFISVDEYQDTNHAQYVFTNLLAKKYRNLCVIGDEDQSIYSWRGATIQNILDFEKDYPDAKIVKLEENYRSTQVILDAAHSVIVKNFQRKPKKLWTHREGGEKVSLFLSHNERHEGEIIANEILAHIREELNPDYTKFVILYRTNAQSRVLEEVFLRYGIPYKIVGGIKFYERKEIKDMIAYLRVIQNPNDSVSLFRILNVPPRKIGNKTIEILQNYAAKLGISFFEAMKTCGEIELLSDSKSDAIWQFIKMIQKLQKINQEFPAAGVIKHVMEETGYKKFLDDGTSEGDERIENIRELISVANKYDSLESGMSLSIFLEEVSLISDIDTLDDRQNAVTFMTVHSAKGLEFPCVFVCGLEEGIFPHSRSLLEHDQLEEERRLMYVAVTRAKDKLYLLHARERMLYGEYRSNAPSQFLSDIPDECIKCNYERESDISYREHVRLEDFGFNNKPLPVEEVVEFDFHDGDKVKHPVFGKGIVLNVTGGIITVAFEDRKYGVKKLALSIAPLKKV